MLENSDFVFLAHNIKFLQRNLSGEYLTSNYLNRFLVIKWCFYNFLMQNNRGERERKKTGLFYRFLPHFRHFIFIAYPCLTQEEKGELSRLIGSSFRTFLSEHKLQALHIVNEIWNELMWQKCNLEATVVTIYVRYTNIIALDLFSLRCCYTIKLKFSQLLCHYTLTWLQGQ